MGTSKLLLNSTWYLTPQLDEIMGEPYSSLFLVRDGAIMHDLIKVSPIPFTGRLCCLPEWKNGGVRDAVLLDVVDGVIKSGAVLQDADHSHWAYAVIDAVLKMRQVVDDERKEVAHQRLKLATNKRKQKKELDDLRRSVLAERAEIKHETERKLREAEIVRLRAHLESRG